MGKRILSIILTITLLCISCIVPYYASFSYADTDDLTEQQLAELSACAYFNVRNSYFGGSNKSIVVGQIKSYIESFFTYEQNNTGIESS